MSERRVLFVTEGWNDEPRMLKAMHRIMMGTKPENIFVFGASVHQFLRRMFVDDEIDEDLDLVSVLMEDADEEQVRVLSQDFSDVYLVFDMDPQDSIYDDSRLVKAMKFFNDSTGNGKLYLNYPMMQSYRHLVGYMDTSFLCRKVTLNDCKDYKHLVDVDCCSYPEIKNVGQYTREMFEMIIYLNLRKVNRLIRGFDTLPDRESYLDWNLSELLDLQRNLLDSEGCIHVVNTSVFNAVDFNPNLVQDLVSLGNRSSR